MADNTARGPLRVVSDIQSEARIAAGGDAFAMPSAGLQGDFVQIAAEFGQISTKIGAWADKAAASEGAQEGHLAGLDPEFRPGRTNTIRGDAFDRAGLETYKAKALTGLNQDLSDAYDKHHADPAKLKAVLAEKTKGWLAQTLPDVRPEIELEASKVSFTAQRQAAREQIARQQADQAAATQLQVAQSLKTIQQRAMTLGLDPQADQVLASDLDGLRQQLTRRGPSGQPLVAPAQARILLEGAREDITTARLMGAYDRLPGLAAKERFVEELQGAWQAGQGPIAGYSLDQFRKAQSLLRSELRRDMTEEKLGNRVLADGLQRLSKAAEAGVELPATDMQTIRAQVITSRDPRHHLAYEEAAQTLAFQQEARRQTPAELDAYIEAETRRQRADGASERDVHRLGLARKLRESMGKELAEDQLGWAHKVGLVLMPPLDLSSPEAFAQGLRGRAPAAEMVAEIYGREAVYLRPAEAAQLQAAAAKGPQHLAGISAAIVAELGPERGVKALAQIGKHAPEVAILGGLQTMGADQRAAADAAAGMALRRVEGFKSHIPSRQKAEAAAAAVYGNGLAALPQTRDTLLATAEAIYEVRARRAGVADFDQRMFETALREAVGENRDAQGNVYGGIAHDGSGSLYGGRKAAVPTWLRQDSLREAVRQLRTEDLAGAPPTDDQGRPLDIKQIHAAKLISVGHGRYHLALTDPDGPNPTLAGTGRSGQFYVLDLNQHRETLRKRLPGAVKEGQR